MTSWLVRPVTKRVTQNTGPSIRPVLNGGRAPNGHVNLAVGGPIQRDFTPRGVRVTLRLVAPSTLNEPFLTPVRNGSWVLPGPQRALGAKRLVCWPRGFTTLLRHLSLGLAGSPALQDLGGGVQSVTFPRVVFRARLGPLSESRLHYGPI